MFTVKRHRARRSIFAPGLGADEVCREHWRLAMWIDPCCSEPGSTKAMRQTQFTLEGQRYVVVCLDEASDEATGALRQLTPSERAVAAQVAEGLSSQAIAAQRGRSVRTVENQIAALFRKLRVASRAELVIALADQHHEAV